MNFAETLGYWYLRLNGFFVLPNFVFHRVKDTREHSADCDLLAVRFPHVRERIGDRECEWDVKAFDGWGLDIATCLVALIVEVKSGRSARKVEEGALQAFDSHRLESAVHRLGIWPLERVGMIVKELENADRSVDGEMGVIVAKLLIANRVPGQHPGPPYLQLALREADDFVRSRMDAHMLEKSQDRIFFPSDLMQYIVWLKEGRGE